ncbi:hypothetical protein [Rhodococcus sp. (in: high G+C Gram-positive bacteria)]|uniref:hypothetical protein n=1 Tax=Rhodococcus sp. TaxID=1831 RepID=UPI003B8A6B4B
MTATLEPTATLTPAQIERATRHVCDLDRQIAELRRDQQSVVGHALAVIAAAAHPGVITVHLQDIDESGHPKRILCQGQDRPELFPLAADFGPGEKSLEKPLAAMLCGLADGISGVWSRNHTTATLRVAVALTLGDRYPFLPIHERLLAHLEERTGRSIRSIEIDTELFDNGYFYSDTVEVAFSDGDSDSVLVDDMADFTDELRYEIGEPGPRTTATIRRTAHGITIT